MTVLKNAIALTDQSDAVLLFYARHLNAPVPIKHIHADAIRCALLWVGAQRFTHINPFWVKSNVEQWAGFYTPADAVKVACKLLGIVVQVDWVMSTKKYIFPPTELLTNVKSAFAHFTYCDWLTFERATLIYGARTNGGANVFKLIFDNHLAIGADIAKVHAIKRNQVLPN